MIGTLEFTSLGFWTRGLERINGQKFVSPASNFLGGILDREFFARQFSHPFSGNRALTSREVGTLPFWRVKSHMVPRWD